MRKPAPNRHTYSPASLTYRSIGVILKISSLESIFTSRSINVPVKIRRLPMSSEQERSKTGTEKRRASWKNRIQQLI